MADEYEEADQISRESERIWMTEMEEKAIKVTNPETGEEVAPWMDADGNPLASCGHREYIEGHCAFFECPNYVGKHMH